MTPPILPPPPDTEPSLPRFEDEEGDSATWEAIQQTAIETLRPTGTE